MIAEEFVKVFTQFSNLEEIQDLTADEKIKLFNVYVNYKIQLQLTKPSGVTRNRNTHNSNNDKYSDKQENLIKQLVKQGDLKEEPDWDKLDKIGASKLIDEGIQHANQRKKERQAKVTQDNFAGSFQL